MRLAEFIETNAELILAEWEAFARDSWPGPFPDPATLRDHAQAILTATATDMQSTQSAEQQTDKSKGRSNDRGAKHGIAQASSQHGSGRLRSGFDLLALLAEYRALRASVIRLWTEAGNVQGADDVVDVTRFNECIDESIAEATRTFAQNSDKAREMFLGILGHDLRNPLNSIQLSADLLSLDENLDGDSLVATRQIAASGEAMTRIVNDLLDFASTKVGGPMPLVLAPTNLSDVCQEVVAELRAGHPNRAIEIQTIGDVRLEADASRLRQLVSNLAANALQHGAPARPVSLVARDEGDTVLLTVRNDGAAIPSESLATLFDPFVRGRSSESASEERSNSVGLGLYIVREIVVAHGGEVDVASSPDAGTTFSVRLPRRGAISPARD